jgi:cell shape-determining protein MreC
MSIIEQIEAKFSELQKLSDENRHLRNIRAPQADIAASLKAWSKVNDELSEIYFYTKKRKGF